MGISVAYHLCIAPDHDTFESSIVNSIEAKREERRLERAAVAAATASPEWMKGSGSRSGGRGAGAEAAQAQAHERRGGSDAQGINRDAAGGERTSVTGDQVSKGVDGGSIQGSLHAEQQWVKGVDGEEWDDWGEVQVGLVSAAAAREGIFFDQRAVD